MNSLYAIIFYDFGEMNRCYATSSPGVKALWVELRQPLQLLCMLDNGWAQKAGDEPKEGACQE